MTPLESWLDDFSKTFWQESDGFRILIPDLLLSWREVDMTDMEFRVSSNDRTIIYFTVKKTTLSQTGLRATRAMELAEMVKRQHRVWGLWSP